MPNNELEVFEYFTSGEDPFQEINFVAYALFAYKRKEWCDHFEQQKGRKPTHGEIDDWIGQLPDFEFRQMRGDAAAFFHTAARAHLETEIEQEKAEAIEDSILDEIREYTSPWRHLAIAAMMAVIAPVAIGGVLFLVGVFDSHFPIQVTIRHSQSPAAASTPSTAVKPDAPPPPHE